MLPPPASPGGNSGHGNDVGAIEGRSLLSAAGSGQGAPGGLNNPGSRAASSTAASARRSLVRPSSALGSGLVSSGPAKVVAASVYNAAARELGGPRPRRTVAFHKENSDVVLEFRRRGLDHPRALSETNTGRAAMEAYQRKIRGQLALQRPGGSMALGMVVGDGDLDGSGGWGGPGALGLPGTPGECLDLAMVLNSSDCREPKDVTFCSLRGRRIKRVDPSGFHSLSELKALDLGENGVSDLTPLAELMYLKELHVGANLVRSLDFRPDDQFLMVEVLDVGYNFLDAECLRALGDMPSLRILTISGNDLCNFPLVLGPFPKLEVMAANGCNLPSHALRALSPLPSLRELYLCDNEICTIPPKACSEGHLPALEYVDLSGNQLADPQEVRAPCLPLSVPGGPSRA